MKLTFSWVHLTSEGNPTARTLAGKFNSEGKRRRWKGWCWSDQQGRRGLDLTTTETLQIEVSTLRGANVGELVYRIESQLGPREPEVTVRINGRLPLGHAKWLEHQLAKFKKGKK